MIGSFSNSGNLGMGIAFTLEDQFNKTSDDIKRGMKGLSGATDIMQQKVNESLSKIRLGASLVAVGAVITAPFFLSIQAASDLNEAMNKSMVVFGEYNQATLDFAQNQASSFGLSKAAAIEAIATYGNLFTALGMGKEQANDYSISLAKLAADLSSFNNVDMQSSILAIRSGMSGEFEALKKFGVAINQELLKQKALQLGLINTTFKGILPPLIKMQATYALLMEQTKNAQGDFLRTNKDYANAVKVRAALVENMKASLGSIAKAVVLPLINMFNTLLVGLEAFSKSKFGSFILKMTFALGALLVVIGSVLVISGGLRFAMFKLAGAFTGTTKAMIVHAFATNRVRVAFLLMKKAALSAIIPLLPYVAIGAAIAAPFVILFLVIRKATKAFSEMKEPANGILGVFQRLGGYIATIKAVASSWDSLTRTFSLTDDLKTKLESLGILENALAIGTWVIRVKSFFQGIKLGFTEVWTGVKTFFDQFKPALAAIEKQLTSWGILIDKNISNLGKWQKAGKVVGAVLIGILAGLTIAMGVFAVNTIIAFAPIIVTIAAVVAVAYILKKAFDDIGVSIEVMKAKWAVLKIWAVSLRNTGASLIRNLWDGMKNTFSDMISWLDRKISSIPILGQIYTVGKFEANKEEPIRNPFEPDKIFGENAAAFTGSQNKRAAVSPVINNQIEQPSIVIENKLHLDGQVITTAVNNINEENEHR